MNKKILAVVCVIGITTAFFVSLESFFAKTPSCEADIADMVDNYTPVVPGASPCNPIPSTLYSSPALPGGS